MMDLMKSWVLYFLLCSSALLGTDLRLRERLEKGKKGDYIVTEANRMITILSIHSITPTTLVLEEISAPLQNLKQRPPSWAGWVKAKAPGHTSWSMVEIDLQTGGILECYSFSRATWIRLSQKESLFATLLQLPLKPVPADKRRKIGPAPMEGEPDVRKEWTPPLVYEGQKLENSRFDVFETVWPQDGTELAGQEISLYFDKEKRFPLPFWIQVQTSHATAALRTIDSGKHLPSMYGSIPRRIPEFIGPPTHNENGLKLFVKSPKYYRDFELFAVDITTKESHTYPLSHSLIHGDDEWLTVEITQEELDQTLQPNHRYTWLLVPSGHTESYTQSSRSFVLSSEKN